PQVEMLDDGGGVGRVVVHVVTISHLARSSVAAAVVCHHPMALADEVEHLRVPAVGAQRPAVVEDDGLAVPRAPILVVDLGTVVARDRGHGRLPSSATTGYPATS